MKKIKLSIIVPVYNAEKYLDKCMQSIYAQTFTSYEIILVNDGSKDNSLALCKKFAQNDKRVSVIDKENGGAGSARNAGIEIAKGEYLAFPDADDWFENDFYETLISAAEKGDYDIVFSGVNYYSQKLEKTGEALCPKVDFISQEECRKNVMTLFPTTTIFDVPWNKIYKRETVIKNNVRFTNLRRCQDAVFNIDVYSVAKKVTSVEKGFYNYIVNDQEKTDIKFPKNYIDINVYYYTHLKEVLTSFGVYCGEVKTHYDSSFVISVFGTLNMFDNPRWNLSKSEKKKYVENILNREDVQSFVLSATVRSDAETYYNVIKNKDVKKVFSIHRKEKFKSKIRNNKFIIKIYRKVKGIK